MLIARSLYRFYRTYKAKKTLKVYKAEHKGAANLVKGNEKFKDAYSGNRCFVLGNGPSLKTVDFSLLENEYVFTVNQLPKNTHFSELKSNFHFWTDSRFFHINPDKEGDMELLRCMQNVNTGDNHPEVFFDLSAVEMIRNYHLDSTIKVNYLATVKFNVKEYLSSKDYDLASFVPDFSTVVQACICSAVYMGFKEIILLGCDQTSILNVINSRMENARVVDYAYELSPAEQIRLQEVSGLSTLSEEFFSQGYVLDTYTFLDLYCKKRGVKLLNATEGSLIETVKRVKLEDILNHEI